MSEESQSYEEGDATKTAIVGLIVVIVTYGTILYCAFSNPALDALKY